VLEGAAGVAASSSAADPFAVFQRGPDRRPAAAYDGDRETAWVSDTGAAGQWLELRLAAPARPASVLVTPLDDPTVGPRVTRLEVSTDAGTVTAPVPAGERPVRVALPPGPTTRVRVTVAAVADGPASGAAGLREVAVDGVRVTEAVALPTDAVALAAAGLPWTVLAQRADGRRGDCVREPAGWVCVGGLAAAGEEDGPLERRFGTPAAASVSVAATVRPRPGDALDALLDRAGGYRAAASSVLTPHPAARAGAAYDGDPATAWRPDGNDPAPQLQLDLGSVRELRGLRLTGSRADYEGVSRVRLRTDDGEVRTLPARRGRTLTLKPVRTRTVVLTFERKAVDGQSPPPVTVREIAFAGVTRPAAGPVRVGCGQGPGVGLDGAGRRLSVRAAVADLLTLAPVPATSCGGPVELAAGGHRLTSARTGALKVASVALTAGSRLADPPVGRGVGVDRWEPESRRLRVAAGEEAYLTLAEGFNAGWRATAGGRELAPVRLDGWRQGWVLPAGGATDVELTFTPGGRHRTGLLVGLAAALLVVLLAAVPTRRPVRPVPRAAPTKERRRWVVAVVLGGLAVLLTGPVGLLAALAALLLPPRLLAPVAAGALALAGLVLALVPGWSAQPALTQLLALTALLLVARALLDVRALLGTRARAPVGEPQQRPLDQHP
jgi:arabinofuranan 3-O-arabinosyltransferase